MPAQPAANRGDKPPAPILVLASSSPYRRALLERLTCRFAWQAPDVDETPLRDEAPAQLVRRLAVAKARALSPAYPHALIIGSDQIAVLEGRVLGKPGDAASAVAQLTASCGRTVRFLTSLCVLDCARRHHEVEVVTTAVRFRMLTADQIRNYVERERPLDCAGSFKCEGLGITLFEAITADDPSALVGLPLIALTGMLARAGIDLLTESP